MSGLSIDAHLANEVESRHDAELSSGRGQLLLDSRRVEQRADELIASDAREEPIR